MPQPLPDSHSIHYRPRLVMERPDHAMGIALVVSEWTALERELIHSFAFALFAFAPLGHDAKRVAEVAWDAMGNIRSRLEFIEAVAKDRIPDDLFAELTNDIHPDVRSRSKERNRVVHGSWHVSEEFPDDLICAFDTEKPMRYSVKDFEDIAGRINATLNKVATYWFSGVQNRLYPFRGPSAAVMSTLLEMSASDPVCRQDCEEQTQG